MELKNGGLLERYDRLVASPEKPKVLAIFARWCPACPPQKQAYVELAKEKPMNGKAALAYCYADDVEDALDDVIPVETVPAFFVDQGQGWKEVGAVSSVKSLLTGERPASARGSQREFVKCSITVRDNVRQLRDKTWAYRRGVDSYTGRTETRTPQPQVDHVMEVQIMNLAFCTAAQKMGPAATVAAQSIVNKWTNDVMNLNVTQGPINQAKKGPFMSYLHHKVGGRSLRGESIDDFARRSSSQNMQIMMQNGYWDKIKNCVVQTHDQLTTKLEDVPNMEEFSDCLGDLVGGMGIE